MRLACLAAFLALTCAAGAVGQDRFQAATLRGINDIRGQAAAAAVAFDERLALAAQIQAEWFAFASKKGIATLDDLHGTSTAWAKAHYPQLHWDRLRFVGERLGPLDRARLAGFPVDDPVSGNLAWWIGENGATLSGSWSYYEAPYAWLGSPPHFANLIDPANAFAGSSYKQASGGGNQEIYALFARPFP